MAGASVMPCAAPCRGGAVYSLTHSLHIAQFFGFPVCSPEAEVLWGLSVLEFRVPVGASPRSPADSPRIELLHLAHQAKDSKAADADVYRDHGGWHVSRFLSWPVSPWKLLRNILNKS